MEHYSTMSLQDIFNANNQAAANSRERVSPLIGAARKDSGSPVAAATADNLPNKVFLTVSAAATVVAALFVLKQSGAAQKLAIKIQPHTSGFVSDFLAKVAVSGSWVHRKRGDVFYPTKAPGVGSRSWSQLCLPASMVFNALSFDPKLYEPGRDVVWTLDDWDLDGRLSISLNKDPSTLVLDHVVNTPSGPLFVFLNLMDLSVRFFKFPSDKEFFYANEDFK